MMLPRQDLIAESARLRAYFETAGASPVESAILQPADALLDLYGEDIRARAYVTADPLRGELMLRPDFTVPVVLDHMAGGADPARYTYSGEVFRKQENDPDRPNEYFQVGFEIFDDQKFGVSDFAQQVNYRRALQGELERTISQVDAVSSTRVHIAIPARQVFARAGRTVPRSRSPTTCRSRSSASISGCPSGPCHAARALSG